MDRLTSGPESDSYPILSPDRSRIVFCRGEIASRNVLSGLPSDPEHPLGWKRVKPNTWTSFVWVMNADGTGARRVSQGMTPRWSPDGRVIAFMIKEHPRKEIPVLFDLERGTEDVLDYEGPQGWDSPCFTPNRKWLVAAGKPHDLSLRLNERGSSLLPGAAPVIALRRNNCSLDLSPDGKWLTWTVDTHNCIGSWIGYAQFDQETGRTIGRGRDCNLGWDRRSVNYDPDFSPCGKYFAYVHADCVEGVKSWTHREKQDVYVSRFPADGVSVRVTWTNAACRHPAWEPAPAE
jgi:Tol biopolymer transport system component